MKLISKADKWKDCGFDKSAPYLRVFEIPLKGTRAPGLYRYSPRLIFRYGIDVKREEDPSREDTFISLSCGGDVERLLHFFPLTYLSSSKTDFSVIFQRTKTNKIVDSLEERDFESTQTIRGLPDGFVIIGGSPVEHNSRCMITEYSRGTEKYKAGLRKIKTYFDKSEKCLREISGVAEEGQEAMTILSRKFNKELEYQLGEKN